MIRLKQKKRIFKLIAVTCLSFNLDSQVEASEFIVIILISPFFGFQFSIFDVLKAQLDIAINAVFKSATPFG